MWYRVFVEEVHITSALVEAQSEYDAKKLVSQGKGYCEWCDFMGTLKQEEWQVEEAADVKDGNYVDEQGNVVRSIYEDDCNQPDPDECAACEEDCELAGKRIKKDDPKKELN